MCYCRITCSVMHRLVIEGPISQSIIQCNNTRLGFLSYPDVGIVLTLCCVQVVVAIVFDLVYVLYVAQYTYPANILTSLKYLILRH